MSKKHIAIVFILSLIFALSSDTFSQNFQKSEQQISETELQLSWNDRLVMHSLRTIHSAEITYQKTVGAGSFGNLAPLGAAELIDPVLASGTKYGYRFTIVAFPASGNTESTFEVRATPIIRRARRLSFYIDYMCEIRGADKFGRDAESYDPVIEPCAPVIPENERLSIASLRTIHGAEMTYQATYGAGEFGSLQQLYASGLVRTGFALFTSYRGYTATMTVTPRTATTPSRFVITIVPLTYRRTGIRSFYMDESGVLRGADKQGLPANENDPPVEF